MRFSKSLIPSFVFYLSILLLVGCSQSSNTITYSPSSTINSDNEIDSGAAGELSYPRTVQVGNTSVIIHPPQVTSWTYFETIEGIAAIETVPLEDEEPRFGVISFSAEAIPNLDERTVRVENLQITLVSENEEELSEEVRALFEATFQEARVIPLDLALSHLADDVIPVSSPGILSDPPIIYVSNSSSLLLLLNGDPVLVPIEGSGLSFAVNTNWSLFYDDSEEMWFLRNDDTWLQASEFSGPWSWAEELSFALRNLPRGDNWRSTRGSAAGWNGPHSFKPPSVFVSTSPAELILIVGEPNLIEVSDGLSYVSNTDSQLFNYANNWYYLVSGRWYVSSSLDSTWQSTTELPEAFASIPENHIMANVLASVPGTIEAKIAVLDAQIPKKTTLARDTQLPETVSYAGEPEFVAIAGTDLMRASNTSFDVIQAGSVFYLCYTGTWYSAMSARGPWSIAATIPAEIYSIPASDPAHNVTYVKVYQSTPTTVTYTYTASYHHVYVYYGVPVYGTGWYYPPYFFYQTGYPVYYGYPYTYGSGSIYNPRTGAYGSASRAYGPYGGWGYASGYNPNTGTYGRAEAVWDYDEWYAVGEAYNPRTGSYFGTERYYDADDGDWKVNSTLQTQRGDVDISRRFDSDSGSAAIRTSAGGEGTFTRRASDGGWDTSGQFTTADGRTINSSGRFENGRGTSTFIGSAGGTGTINRSVGADGVTRQGTFSRGDQSLSTNTTRDGLSSSTRFETSDGARGVVGGQGLGSRSGIGQTASGDVYATRDGNVFRRTGNGWEQRSGGNWSSVGTNQQRQSITNRTQNRSSVQNRSLGADQRQSITNRTQSLNRQARSRQIGQNRSARFQQQRSGGGLRRRR